jgi:hypothetical protein
MTGTEIAPRPPVTQTRADEVVLHHPDTGEILNLATASDEDLASWRRAVMNWEATAKIAKKICDAELVRRMDSRNVHTLHLPGVGTASAPAATERDEYDGEAIAEDLFAATRSGDIHLTWDAINAAVKREVVYKPQPAKLKGLLKQGGSIAEIIRSHTTSVPIERRVTVKAS